MPRNKRNQRQFKLHTTGANRTLVAICGSLSIGASAPVWSAVPKWDCSVSADGDRWVCLEYGQPAPEPAIPVAPEPVAAEPGIEVTPVAEPTMPTPKPIRSDSKNIITPTRPDSTGQAAPAPEAKAKTLVKPADAAETATESESPAEQAAVQDQPVRPEPEPTASTQAIASTTRPGLDEGINWGTCGIAVTDAIATPWLAADDPEVAQVEADSAQAAKQGGSAQFQGNVHFTYGEQTIDSDTLAYDRDSKVVTAEGNILLQRPDMRVAGSKVEYNLESREGSLEQTEYRVFANKSRGTADLIEFHGSNQSHYKNLTYTTCRPGNSDWILSAEQLELDHESGVGTAKNAKLTFLGVPIFALPSMTFPIDNQRKSGVLVPSVGYSDNTGFDVSVPYYVNLAPNYDLTLIPRLMGKRGAALGAEFRFLTEQHEGTLKGEILPDDREYQDGGARGAFSIYSHSDLAPRWDADVRVNYVSDDQYLEDLGDSLAVSSTRNLERAGEVRYHGDYLDLLGRVQYYQTLDDTLAPDEQPYSRLPQILAMYDKPDGPLGLSTGLRAEYVYFDHSSSDVTTGHRVDLHPSVSLPLREPWGYVEPKLTGRYTTYELNDAGLGKPDSPDRSLATFSLDSGLFSERSSSLFGHRLSQTLEPRLFYLYVPYRDQSDLPVFDTSALDFNFDNLFRLNRFNGPDRVGDANQLTLALTSRMLSEQSGEELLRASIGQILYFRDREVTLPDEETVAEDSSSSVVAQVDGRINEAWRARAGVQVDPHNGSGEIKQALAQISYRDNEKRVFNAAYRYRDDIVDQTDIAAIWPLSNSTSLIGRWNYSLRESQTLETLAGVEYGQCCWRVRAVMRSYLDDDTDDQNLSFMVQLELNGLGRLGNDIDSFLERGIYGYRTDD